MPKPKESKKDLIAIAALVDEYGRLDAELAPLKPKLRRMEAVAKLLRAAVPEKAKADESVMLAGGIFDVALGPREHRTVFAPAATIYRKIGKEVFLEIASVTLKALEEHVHPSVVAELTHKEHVGSRPIDVWPKAIPLRAA